MKHRLLSLLFACCIAAAGFSAVNYSLNESFESGIPSTWTQEVLSATTQMWIADTNNDYPAGAADGNGRVAFRNTTGESQGYVTRLITPAMDLSGVSSPQLTFAYAQPSRSGANDQLKVYYRLTSTSEWVLLRSYEEAKASWTRDTIDLIATSQGTEYQLAFEGIENGGFDRGVVLDDVKVSPESQCSAAPEGLSVIPDATTAVISWSRINDGRTYEVIVSTSAIADLDNYDVSGAVFHQSGISGRNVTATGLTAQNHYFAYLRSTCDDNESGYSAWASAVEFDTPCEALTSLQEGFETMEKGSYASEAPECWNILNANTGSSYTYPQIYVNDNSTYVHAGTKSLYFISSSTTYCYAILPALADVSNKQIEFYYKDENASSSGRLFIGYMTDIAEESSFIEIEEFIRSTSWTKGTADFSMAPDGARIAFKYGGASNNYYMGIDDIVISNLPDCRKVSSLNVSNVAGTSAVVNFATFTAAQNYQVVVATEALTLSGDPTAAQLAKIVYNNSEITASGVNVEGLTTATTYYVYARALCGGEEAGEWSTGVSFTTRCEMPWKESFETITSGVPAGWDNTQGTSSAYYRWSSYATGYNGRGLRFDSYSNSNGNTNTLATPSVYLTENAILSFYWKNPTGGDAKLYVSQDGGTTKDEITSVVLTAVADWTLFEVDLTAYTGSSVNVYFASTSNYGNGDAYHYLDEVSIRKIPTCKDIASVAVSAVTNSGAKVVFGNTGAANYQVIVATESAANPDTLDASKIVFNDATLTDTVATITGLTANTAYFAYVRGVCGSEDLGAWTEAVSFRTSCDPIVIASKDEPWIEDFESYSASSSTSYSATYKFNAECWNHQLINGSNYFHVYKPSSGTNTTKQLCSKEASGLKVLLALPSMSFEEANAYAFSLDMNRTSTYTNFADSLYIYANTSAALDGSEVLLAAIPRVYSNAGVNVPAESEAGWKNYEFIIPIAGNGNIILYVSSKNGDPILIDNLKVRKLPDCRDMGAVAIKSVKTHGATIEFPANGAAQYQIVLATKSIDPTYVDSTNVPTSIIYNQLVSAASNIIEDAAIAANSDIYVYVRAYCGVEEQGKWSNEVSFHTLCEPYTIDEFGLENFENKDRINCWTLGFNTEGTSASYAYAQRDSSAAYGAYLRLSKENAADTYNDGAYAITPELNVADITLYEVSFSAATTNNSNAKNLKRVLVGVTTNPSDPNMMQTLKAFNLDYAADSSALKDYTVSLADAEEDEDGNKPRYVFFMAAEPAASHDSTNYVLIDNVTFALRSSCAQVIETSVANLTTDGASISWENVGAGSYQVLVAEVNSKEPDTLVALSSEIVNTNAATIGGLQSNSTYYAYVRGICGVGDTAKWSNAIAFHTTIGIPYLEPFSAATLNEGWKVYKYQSSADSVNIANMSLPASSDAKWVMTTSNVPTGMAGNIAQFRFPYTSGTYYANSWLISPTIDLAGHEDDFIELTFKMAGSNLYTSGTIAVYVSKDGAQSFKKLTTISASDLSATAADFKVKLTKFAGQKINIAFYVYQYYDYSTPRVLSLDSVSVHTYDAVCMGVENLNVALNGLAIDASWEIEGTPAKTIVELSDDATFATFIDSVVVEGAFTHQFTGLQLSKTYYVRAKQADCANAKWVVSNAIKTPIGVPYNESFNVSSIPSDWSKMEGAPASAFAGTAPTATTSGWAISSSSYGLPANHVKINIYSSGSNKWLVSPAIDMTSIQATDSVVLSFDFAYTAWNSASGPDAGSDQALLLLVSTDGGTTWSAANGYEWSHTDSIVANVSKTLASIPTTGTTITLTDFARYAGHSIKFAFVATTTSGDNDFHIANVSLKQIMADCDDPTELALEGGSRQIAVTWNGDTNKSSIIQWSKTSDFASLKADTIESGLAYTIESLDPGATYYVRVQQICAGGNTDFTATLSAGTACETIAAFPWNEDFSSFENGTLVNPCWKNQHTLGTATSLFSIGETTHEGNNTKQLYLPDQNNGNRTLLSLPEMNISEADVYAFKLDVYRQSSSKTKEGVIIYASLSDTIDASAVRLAHVIRAYNIGNDTVPAETAVGWYTYEFAIPMSGTVRILLEGISEYGNATYMDNFQVYRMPTCRQVKNVAVDSIGNDTALVMFDTLKVTVPYEVLVATAEIDFTKELTAADSAKIVIDDKTITASPAVIRGLVPGAHYYVYVRALCSEEEQGDWSKVASFRTVPTCDDMKTPKSVAKSGNSVTIAFTKTNAANYQLLATLAAINPDTLANVADSIIAYDQVVSEDTVEIAGLQPLTNYYVYVRGVCAADDMGAWSASLKVKTACGAINTFPWTEGFENYSTGSSYSDAPECWGLLYANDGSAPYIYVNTSSGYVKSGSKSLYFSSSSSRPGFVIMPEMTNVNNLSVKFSYRHESASSSGRLFFGYMTNIADSSTFVLLQEFDRSTSWQTVEATTEDIPDSVADIARLAIKYGKSSSSLGYYMGIDDIEVSVLPSCRNIKGMKVAITSSSVKATWEPTNAGQYQVILANAEITPSYVDSVSGIDVAKLIRIDTVNAASFSCTALTPSTDYYIYVRGLCDENDKGAWNSTAFTTGCYVAVPYVMDFDDAEDRKVSYSSYKIPSCFNSIAGGSGNPARIYDEDEENSSYYTYSYAHSGTSSLRIYSSSTTPQFVTLPEMNQRTDTLALTFKARALYAYVYTSSGSKTVTNYASSSYAHALKIGTMTDPMDTASFQLIEKVELNEIATTPSSESDDPAGNNYWENFTVYLTGATGKFIAFVSDFSATNYVWIDDVRVDFMPDCRVPAQINITPDKHTADIEWVGSADEYELAIGAQGFNLPGGEADSIYTLDTTFLHAEGLTANTAYDVYIRSACDEGLYSAWSKVTTFRTDCDVFALPFSENFNALESGIPSCWDNSEGTTTTESYKWSHYEPTSTSTSTLDTCLRFDSYFNSSGNTNILATPAIVLSDDAYLSFRIKNPTGDSAQVFIGKAGEVQRDTLQKCIKSLSSWTDYKFDLSKYTGDTVQIYFKGKSNWGSGDAYIYLDDVKVTLYPACRDIETIDVLNVTNVSAAASWTKTKALQYQVILADSAITPAYIDGDSLDMTKVVLIDTVDVSNIEFSGLTAQTTYYIYVRGLCANEEQSAWTTARSFTTECDPLTITANSPWTEGFEDYNGAVYNARGVVPDCWSASATGSYAPHVIGSGSYYYTHEGTKALTFYGSGNCYAVLPAFTNALNTLKIEFYMQAQNASYGTLSLGYITAEDDNMSTFTVIDTYESVAGQMALRETELDEVPANATHLVFRWYYSSQYSCCIDDVTLKFMPACKRVRRLEVLDIATDTAVVSFANSGAANYELVVANAAINPDSVATSDVAAHVVLHNVALADTAAVIRSLNASSEYFVYVRGLCDESEHSEAWTSTSFITACGVISTFPWTDDLERYATGTFEGLCWTNGHIAGEYDFSIANTAVGVNATNKLYIKYQYVGSSAGGTTATAVATLPVFRIDSANAYGVSLDMYRADDSYGDIEGVRILASLSSVLDNSAVELGYICRHYDKAITGSVPAESAAGWYTYEFAIPLEGEVYIFVRAEQEYDANSFFMDNFRVRQLPICGKVTGMEASDITASSATISFPATSATSYHVIVASAALDLTKALSAADSAKIVFDETLTDTVAAVTGLTANTLYYAYARGVCDGEDSEWSTGMLFRTECGSISLPYSQNFDNTSDRKQIEGTSYYLPLCWNEGHSSTSAMSRIYTNSDSYYYSYLYARSGSSALGVISDASNASYAVLPLIETDGANGIELNFEARALYVTEEYDDYSWYPDEVINNYATSSYAHSIKIGLMSDPSDLSTFSLVEEVTLTELASTPSSVSDDPNGREYWENHTVRLNAPAGKYIAFVSDYSKANIVWIDDIQAIEFNASCQGVDSLEVSNVSISGFDVAFHYNVADDDNDARIAISASETLDLDNVLLLDTIYNDSVYSAGVTLASGRPYYVFVQQFCGEDGASAWEMVEIKTPYMVRYEPVFTSTTIPSDWNRYTGLVDNVLAGTTNLASTTSGWYLTPANAIINSTHFHGDIYGGSFNYWVVTPTIDLTPNVGEGLLLGFEAGLTPYSSSYVDVRNDGTDDRFAVLVTTDNGATWTKVAEWNNSGTGDYVYNDVPEEGAAYRLNLSNFAGQNIRIAFYGESTESNADNYFHFGNIVLDKCVAKTYIDQICNSGDDYDGSQAAEPNPFHVTADKYHVGLNTFSEFHPSTGAGDVDSMIILNLYVYDYFITDLYATVCEGSHYGPDENGFEFDAELGMADKRKILTSSIGCDSTIILHITVNQAITVHVYDSVEQGLAYEWNGKEYYTAGTYQFTTESEVTGCDSTTVLHLSVYQSEEAIPSVQAQSLLIAPNPVKAGEPIQVLTSFTADELANAHIEIVSATGALVYVQHGADEPFILPGLPISGVYVVRIRIDDAIYISSLLVK